MEIHISEIQQINISVSPSPYDLRYNFPTMTTIVQIVIGSRKK